MKIDKRVVGLMSLRATEAQDRGSVIISAYVMLPGGTRFGEATLTAKEARQLAAMLLFHAEEVST